MLLRQKSSCQDFTHASKLTLTCNTQKAITAAASAAPEAASLSQASCCFYLETTKKQDENVCTMQAPGCQYCHVAWNLGSRLKSRRNNGNQQFAHILLCHSTKPAPTHKKLGGQKFDAVITNQQAAGGKAPAGKDWQKRLQSRSKSQV